MRTSLSTLVWMSLSLFVAASATAVAQTPPAVDRDNTRAMGRVFTPAGEGLSNVEIEVRNAKSPAQMIRARTRKGGDYLIRNLGNVFSREDYDGIVIRLRYESPGYEVLETELGIRRDGLEELYVVMQPEGGAEMEGICTVLRGRVTNSKGKKVKAPQISVSGGGTELAQATGEKNGDYEIVLWNAPPQVEMKITSSAGDKAVTLDLQAPADPHAFLPQSFDIQLD